MKIRLARNLLFQAFLTAFILYVLPVQASEIYSNLGLYGGTVFDIAIDPSNTDRIFASSYMGDGLYISTNGGEDWNAVEGNGAIGDDEVPGAGQFNNHSVYEIKIAPSDPNVIWVAHNYWLEKSIDGGLNWTHISNNLIQGNENRICRTIAIDPNDSKTVYVGTSGIAADYNWGAIYKTTDGGMTWTKMNQGNDFFFFINHIAIDPNNPDVLWAITNSIGKSFADLGLKGALYRSGDGGESWEVIHFDEFYDVEIKPNDSNLIFTAGDDGIKRHHYDNQTGSWKWEWILITDAYEAKAISFDPQNPDLLYASWNYPSTKIAKGISPFNDSDWDIYDSEYDFRTIYVHPDDSEVLFGSDRELGIFKSHDQGKTFIPINNGINSVIVYDVAVDPNDSEHFLAATGSGVYEKKTPGDWARIFNYESYAVLFNPENSKIFYAGRRGYLSKTINGGENWTVSNELDSSKSQVSDIAVDQNNTDNIFITSYGDDFSGRIYRSVDGGNLFNEVLLGVNQSSFNNYPFNTIAINPADSLNIFAGGGNFYAPVRPGDLWESNDGGDSWERTSLQDVVVNAILIDPRNPEIMYAGAGWSARTEVPLYKSSDGGSTWSASFQGIPGYDDVSGVSNSNAVVDLEFHPQNNNIIYAATSKQGIYISLKAENWLNLGTPAYNVFAIAVSSLYAATQGGMQQLTGTGVITGEVTDADSREGINNATISNDLGSKGTTVNGEYMLISSAGICEVYATADGHNNVTQNDITVYGGDVTWLNIVMEKGVSNEPDNSDTKPDDNNGSAGKGCFIATASFGSPLSKHVQILTRFRDTYLLTNSFGQKFVRYYYQSGRPMADYVEAHPWLKPPVRVILYPLVGFAWIALSDYSLYFFVIFLTILLVFIVRLKKLKSGGYNEI